MHSVSSAPALSITFWNTKGPYNLYNNSFRTHFDVGCFSETWSDDPRPTSLPGNLSNFLSTKSPALRDCSRGRASGGLLSIAEQHLKPETVEVSPWWIFTKIDCHPVGAIIGSFYFSPSLDLKYLLDLLQEVLNDLVLRFENHIFVLGGDFNCRVGNLDLAFEEVFEGSQLDVDRSSLDGTSNARGSSLSDFMHSNGLVLINGRSVSDSPAQFTFIGSNGLSVIDLVWISADKLELVNDLYIGTDLVGSDHLPVYLSLALDSSSRARTVRIAGERLPAAQMRLCWVPENRDSFLLSMASSTRLRFGPPHPSTDDRYSNLCLAIKEAAGDSGMLRLVGRVVGRRSKAWFDVECVRARKAYTRALGSLRASRYNYSSLTSFLQAKAAYIALTKKKKRLFAQATANKFAFVGDPASF